MPLTESYLSPRRVLTVLLAGGRGRRLADLTDWASKPGLDFGGKFKIIDFTLSNCVNSGFRRIAVLTQYNSHRLIEHLAFAWSFLPGALQEFIHIWPAQQSLEKECWYNGTADAVFQNVENIRKFDPQHVLVLAGDHVYRMDYKYFLHDHLNHDADMTIACLEVPRLAARGFGIAQVDKGNRILSWVEKPEDPPALPGRPDRTLASMGIYLFKAEFLFDELMRDARTESGHDFGHDLIPILVRKARVYAHRFEQSCIPNPLNPEPYWRDVGTVDAYWEANMDLVSVQPALNLYDYSWPIYTHQEQLPPAKIVHRDDVRQGSAVSSLISGGCIVSGAHIRDSLLFTRSRVHSYAQLQEAVVLPQADIGEYARLRRVVVDRGCRIPPGLVVGEDPDEDARRFHRTANGVTLISQAMLDRLNG
ncbi:MAG: glucose-1-phosphate adenylyltransferase [Acidobacteriota bacterium]|nr:glucose-1-phosphate adenylyltransferase [Acidobacteriota bacterium]